MTKPVVVAIEMTAKAVCRSVSPKFGYVPLAATMPASSRMLTPTTRSIGALPDRDDRRERQASQRHEVRGEIHRGDEHEHHQHELDGWRVEVRDAGVVGRESAQRHGREGMADGIEPAMPQSLSDTMQAAVMPAYTSHSALAVSVMRGVSFASFTGPGVSARYICMPPTPSSGRMATRQHDDAHAAQPVQRAAPQVHRVAAACRARDDGGAGGRQAGHGLEVGIGEAQVRDRQHQRQRGRCRHQHPARLTSR